MSPLDNFLSRVDHHLAHDGLHGTFSVPTRRDKRHSGVFRLTDDGRLLIFDHGGDSAAEILVALGLTLADLYPNGPQSGRAKPEKRPFVASDVLRTVAADALLASAAAVSVAAGEPVTAIDREALIAAASRIQRSLAACGLEAKRAQ